MDSGTDSSRKLSFVFSKSLATLKLLLRGTGPSWSWIAEVQPPTSALISSEVSHQPAPDQHSQPSKPFRGPAAHATLLTFLSVHGSAAALQMLDSQSLLMIIVREN